MKTYKYRPGTQNPGQPADVVGPELERIWKDNNEELKTTDVVDAARPKNAPLHPCFEWDNKIAANEYRLGQARNLVKSVVVEVENEDPHPIFVHVTVKDDDEASRHHYQHTSVITSKPREYAAALDEARQKLNAAYRSWDFLRKLKLRDVHDGADDEQVRALSALMDALSSARVIADRLT